ncbi:MAG: hypothetical protein PVG78_04670 [Desulfobacterales bacterium]
MKRILPLVFLLTALLACTGLPPMRPAPVGDIACDRFFVQDRWQFVHRLRIQAPGGRTLTLLGVTLVSSGRRSLQSALMTPEGMVLFEADAGPPLAVQRSVPPFDRKGFARGLMDDVKMIFLVPEGSAEPGAFEDGAIGCRYRLAAGGWLDAAWEPNGVRRIIRYDSAGKRIREVTMERGAPGKGRMVLTATGSAGYRIEMEAIEAVRLGE